MDANRLDTVDRPVTHARHVRGEVGIVAHHDRPGRLGLRLRLWRNFGHGFLAPVVVPNVVDITFDTVDGDLTSPLKQDCFIRQFAP